jgi:phosphocarrier protein FPr
MKILTREMVVVGAQVANKEEAIKKAGQVLVSSGCVEPSYVEGMVARERVMSTYLGNGIAIPHGELADLCAIHHTAASVLQVPEGVEWEPGERAYLVVGLASIDDEHLILLHNLLELLQAPETITTLIHTLEPMVLVERLLRERSEIGWN